MGEMPGLQKYFVHPFYSRWDAGFETMTTHVYSDIMIIMQ